ncbi:MAG: DUF1080 domain-containing protein [Verrucomicrobiota bacterium]|nr:DUF1080 domain-containing protein [Verrucomicrobiota bacterium]
MKRLLLAVFTLAVSFSVAAGPFSKWESLFDGKSTDKWRALGKPIFPAKGWVITNGVLRLEPKSDGGNLISVDKYSEFDLEWEWRIGAKGNNGLKYFVIEERGAIGHEYQMIDDTTVDQRKHATGSFYDVLPPVQGARAKKIGEWNKSRIRVQGNQVTHWLNGKRVLQYELDSPELKSAIAKSKFKETKPFGSRIEGHIVLTDHHDEVSYRKIRIRRLSSK